MAVLEVFADIACPFTHVGLQWFVSVRDRRDLREPYVRVRAWPLEVVNGAPLRGADLTPTVAALRSRVAPHLFRGFDSDRFINTSIPALASEAAANREGRSIGERFSLAVREALFEHGMDVADPAVLAELRAFVGAPDPTEADVAQVLADRAEGVSRGVVGSPHFFTPDGRGWFCPSLVVDHQGGGLHVALDGGGLARFVESVWADPVPERSSHDAT